MQRKVNMILNINGTVCAGVFNSIENDAIHIKGDGVAVNDCYVYDKPEPVVAEEAHRDALQAVPTQPNLSRSQFAGARISNITIANNRIICHSKMQPIFSSDGRMKNVIIANNTIYTQSDHCISINGLESGELIGNRDLRGNYVRILAQPLRIGGESKEGKCLWIVGFKNPEDDYQCLIIDEDNQNLEDKRRCTNIRPNISDYYLTNFDIDAYQAQAFPYLIEANAQQIATPIVCTELINQALQYGNLV